MEGTLLHNQQSQQHGGYLDGVQILGESRHLKRIRKLFENSSVKIKVVQDRPTVQDTWDDDTKDTLTEAYTDIGDADIELCSPHNIYGSSDDNSSGLDSDEEPRTATPDSLCTSPQVSPEIRNRRNMILVQSKIKNFKDKTLITPTRMYLKEATFIKHRHHYFIFYLFDDLLVITKAKENPDKAKPGALRQVKFCKALDLRYLTVEAIPDSSKGCHLLKFHYIKSITKRWKRVFSCPTKEQKDTWFSDLRKLRDQLTLGPNFAALFKNVF